MPLAVRVGVADKVLQSVGVQARKYFTPAQTLALQLASRKNEGQPLEGQDLRDAQRRFALEDRLRDAINSRDNQARSRALADIRAQQRDGHLSARQAGTLIQNAEKYPSRLLALTERLSLEDALQVWDKAGLAERRQLLPLIYSKIQKWQEAAATSGKSPGQLQDMRNRIADFRHRLIQ